MQKKRKERPANPKLVLLNKPYGVLSQFSGEADDDTLKIIFLIRMFILPAVSTKTAKACCCLPTTVSIRRDLRTLSIRYGRHIGFRSKASRLKSNWSNCVTVLNSKTE